MSSEGRFTPEPWSAHCDGWRADIWAGDVYSVHVAEMSRSEKSIDEIHANARLMAESKNLFAMVQRLLPTVRRVSELYQGAPVERAMVADAEALLSRITTTPDRGEKEIG